MTDTYRIADKVIRISSLYKDVHDYCVDYRSDGKPDFEVITTENDILFEKEKSEKEALIENKKPVFYSDGYLEELAVYRKIAEKMIDYNIILFHSSVISVDGQAYAFTAKSGTGKSTHVSMWLRYIPGSDLMNDDNPIIRIIEDKVYIYGSPWSGKTPCYRKVKAKLGAITRIDRAKVNSIEKLSPVDTFASFLPSCSSMKWDSDIFDHICNTIGKIIEHVPVYTLHCLPNQEAAEICYQEIHINNGHGRN